MKQQRDQQLISVNKQASTLTGACFFYAVSEADILNRHEIKDGQAFNGIRLNSREFQDGQAFDGIRLNSRHFDDG